MSRLILVFDTFFNEKRPILNYALNEDTGFSVIMPDETIDYFCAMGAYFDEQISEWVLENQYGKRTF